jgi:glutamate:Na+ symporter, ESS family
MLTLDWINTVAFGGGVLFVGHGLRRAMPPLARYNIPAPVVGGLLVAVGVLVARSSGHDVIAFDTRLQATFQIAFFTTVGLGASVSLLKVGGPQVVVLLVLASVLAVVQNAVGITLAKLLGMHPLFGVLTGSVTLAGGPATGLAFAPAFEQAGVPGAATVAIAASIVGIIAAGLVGGPVATILIERYAHRRVVRGGDAPPPPSAPAAAVAENRDSYAILKTLVVILIAMWLGSGVSAWFTSMRITLPAYIGAMIVAAIIRNVDDAIGVVGMSQGIVADLGAVALSLFLVLALMTLKLWELAGLALPMIVILAVQIVVAAAACWPTFYMMGRDYDAAVMQGGFAGFMLGTTANAMANMESLVGRYGPSPRAFLVVPIVGAFLIDFVNAVIITFCLNVWG